MTNSNLTIGTRVAIINTAFPFAKGDDDFRPGMIRVVVGLDHEDEGADVEVEFESARSFSGWGDSRALAVIPDDVVSVEGELFTKLRDEGLRMALTPYTPEATASMSTQPAAGQRWKRTDYPDREYLVITLDASGDFDSLRFANTQTGELYKESSLFGKKGEGLFFPADAQRDGTPPPVTDDEDLAPDTDDADKDNTDTPQAGQVWRKGDSDYLVVDTEQDGPGTLRFMNVATGEFYKRDSLYGRRGEGQFAYVKGILGMVVNRTSGVDATDPAAGSIVCRVKRGQTLTYIAGNTEVEGDDGSAFRFFNTETGKPYSRSSLFGKRGQGKFFYA